MPPKRRPANGKSLSPSTLTPRSSTKSSRQSAGLRPRAAQSRASRTSRRMRGILPSRRSMRLAASARRMRRTLHRASGTSRTARRAVRGRTGRPRRVRRPRRFSCVTRLRSRRTSSPPGWRGPFPASQREQPAVWLKARRPEHSPDLAEPSQVAPSALVLVLA